MNRRSSRIAAALLSAALILGGCATSLGGPSVDESRRAAENGDATAQLRLALAYDYGRGVRQDQAEAAKWYRKAADQGNVDAQNSLGSMYQLGHGVPVNYGEAMSWYQRAAAQGHADANANIGSLFDFGLGVAKDHRKAAEYYQVAVDKGSATAMLNLGVSYWRGEGVQKDLAQAYKWLDLGRFYTQNSHDQRLKWRIRGALDEVAKEASPAEIAEGKQLARAWDAANRRK